MSYTLSSCDIALPTCQTDDKSPVEDFLKNTSITIVSNVQRRNGIAPKIIWLLVASISFSVAAYQSYGLINDFLQCKIKQVKEYNPQNFPPFPSITVCDGIPVNWTYLQLVNHSIYQEVSQHINSDQSTIRSALILGLLRLTEKERQELFTHSAPFQPEAHFTSEIGVPNVTFRDIVFGQCVTFNDAISLDVVKLIGVCSIYGMHIRIPIELEGRVPKYSGNNVYLLVHARGSPPIPVLEKSVNLYPFDKITIQVEQDYVVVEPDQKCLHCIQCKDKQSFISAYDDPSNNVYYGYSTEACIMEEVQKLQLSENNCVDISAPLRNIESQIYDNTTLCSGTEILKLDKCQEMCENITDFGNDMEWGGQCDDSPDAIVRIHQTKGYNTVRKLALYSIWDLLGIIGGNVSLWLGISMLSVWEVIELGCLLARKKMKHFGCLRGSEVKATPTKGHITHVFKIEACSNDNKLSTIQINP